MSENAQLVSHQLKAIAEKLNKDIFDLTGEKLAFTLMIFTEGQTQYISSIDRATSLVQIKKMIKYWEMGMPDIPAHEKH